MTNPAMPSTAREADARPVNPSPEPVLGRAEDVLPSGYTPTVTASERAAQHLAEAREVLALTRVAADAGANPDVLRFLLGQVGGQLRNAAVLLRTGVAVLALALVGTLLPIGGTPAAQAVEAPQPDPVPAAVSVPAPVVSVTLNGGTVAALVPVSTSTTNRRGRHCSSVWAPIGGLSTGPAILGRACSRSARFVVPVTLDSPSVPVGTSRLVATDDLDPFGSTPQVITLVARRPSRFGVGRWVTLPQGQVYVSAPLAAYTPALGVWTPQQASPVQVQELVHGRWIVRATLTTSSRGVASGVIYVGAGAHVLRVARPVGATVTATTGTARTFVLAPEVPIDVV